MSFVSVPALYDGTRVNLLEPPPIDGPYHVFVTFIEPVDDAYLPAHNGARFWASFSAWQDDRPVDATLDDIYSMRRSRAEPPAL